MPNSTALPQAVDAEKLIHQKPSLSKEELTLWQDPSFKRKLTESYLSETEIEPTVTVEERDQLEQAFNLISTEKLEEAITVLEEGRTESSSAVFDFTVANIRFQQEELDKAAEAYKIAVMKHPKFRRAWSNLGLIYVRQGNFKEALPALTRVLSLGGGDGLTYGLLGYAYSSIEDHLPAETAYRMAILMDPQTPDWKMGLARSLFKQERFTDAVSLCNQLIAAQPERADLWLLQANAYIGLTQPLKAAQNYELVDRLGKSTVDSLNTLGDIYVNEELYEMAVETYIRGIDLNPQRKAVRAIRASKVLTARGAIKETRKLVDHIESVQGDSLDTAEHKDLLKLKARLAVAEGAGEEEAKVLEEIIELDPLDGEALILLGQHSARAKNYEKAAFYYERAANIEKFEADAKVRHAQLMVEQGKYANALPLLRRAQDLKPRTDVQKYLEQIERVAKGR